MNCIIMEYRLTDQFGRYIYGGDRAVYYSGAQYFIDFVLFIVPTCEDRKRCRIRVPCKMYKRVKW